MIIGAVELIEKYGSPLKVAEALLRGELNSFEQQYVDYAVPQAVLEVAKVRVQREAAGAGGIRAEIAELRDREARICNVAFDAAPGDIDHELHSHADTVPDWFRKMGAALETIKLIVSEAVKEHEPRRPQYWLGLLGRHPSVWNESDGPPHVRVAAEIASWDKCVECGGFRFVEVGPNHRGPCRVCLNTDGCVCGKFASGAATFCAVHSCGVGGK